MNELTRNTINFCKNHQPFRTQENRSGPDLVAVVDRLGLTIATSKSIDDAWYVTEALNEVAKKDFATETQR